MKTYLRQFFMNHPAPTFAAFFVVVFGSIVLISILSVIGIGFVGTAYYDPSGEATARLISDLAENNFSESWFVNVFAIAKYWILGIALALLSVSMWGALHKLLNKERDVLLHRERLKKYLDILHKRELNGYCCGGATYSPNILVEIKDQIDSRVFDEVPL